MIEIGLFLIGAFISWVIAHYYYSSSKKSQNKIYNKLSKEIRNLILSDKRNSLSVIELNELLKKKTIDKESTDVFPFLKCPNCGSESLNRSEDYVVDINPGDYSEPVPNATPYQIIECKNCGWKKSELNIE